MAKKVTNVPNLRFPSFEGEWETKKLGEIATNKSKKYNPKNENTFTKCIELEHLASETGQLLGFTDGSKLGSIKNVFRKRDVLFGKLRPYLKKYYQPNFDGVCSSEIWVLTGKEISNDFLYYLIQTNGFIDLANQSSGSKMPRADWNILENGLFSFPKPNEQQKISSFLSLLDSRIDCSIKIINDLRTLKSATAKKIFSQELRFKDDNGNDYPNWEILKLQDICEIIGGGTPETNKAEYWNGHIQWFTPTEIKSNFVSKSERTISELGLKNSSAKLLPKGTILLTTRATIGEVSITLEECTTNQGFQSLIVKENYNNIFLFNWLKISKYELEKRANGSTFPEISKSEIEKIDINIPCLEEQAKIANFLSSIDSKIDVETQIMNKLGEQKKFLLQQMFV